MAENGRAMKGGTAVRGGMIICLARSLSNRITAAAGSAFGYNFGVIFLIEQRKHCECRSNRLFTVFWLGYFICRSYLFGNSVSPLLSARAEQTNEEPTAERKQRTVNGVLMLPVALVLPFFARGALTM